MKIKIFLSSLLLIIVVIISVFAFSELSYKTYPAEAALVKAFQNSGAKIMTSEIYYWGNLSDSFKGIKELDSLSQKLIADLQLKKDEAFSNNSSQTDTIQKVEVSGKMDGNKRINIIIQINKGTGGGKERDYSITVTQDLSDEGLEEVREKVLNILRKYGLEPSINSCITGYFDGKLNSEQLDSISSKILRNADAKKVENAEDERMVSLCAYSPSIENYIRVNGRRVNLSLAIRYNSYEDKTYIWLATPLITTEY